LSLEVYGRECVFVIPRSARRKATGLADLAGNLGVRYLPQRERDDPLVQIRRVCHFLLAELGVNRVRADHEQERVA
jgi:hypothetical protein